MVIATTDERPAAAAAPRRPQPVPVDSRLDNADRGRRLFDKLNRERRRITTWDHWHARKAAGDNTVLAIEAAVAGCGLRIHNQPSDGNVRCTTTLEKVHTLGGPVLVEKTLRTVVDVWDNRLDAFDAPIVAGLALVLHHLAEPLDEPRLIAALLDVLPRQLKTQALALRDLTTGTQPVLTAIAVMNLYNRRAGRKILVSNRTFNGGSRNAHSVPVRGDVPPRDGASLCAGAPGRASAGRPGIGADRKAAAS